MARGGTGILDTLRGGAADISLGRIGPLPSAWPTDLVRRLALVETVELLVPPDHPWTDRDEVACGELAGRPLCPMTGAPREWTDLLAEFAADFELTIASADSAPRAPGPQVPPVSFLGSFMPTPAVPGVRRVPIVAPVPVFAWWAVWRSTLPTHLVEPVLAAFPPPPDLTVDRGPRGRWWAPRADRAALTAPA